MLGACNGSSIERRNHLSFKYKLHCRVDTILCIDRILAGHLCLHIYMLLQWVSHTKGMNVLMYVYFCSIISLLNFDSNYYRVLPTLLDTLNNLIVSPQHQYFLCQDEQLRMSLLFLTSLFLFLIADIGLGKILTNSGDLLFGSKILVMSVFLSGSILFSVWLILYVQKSVRMTIKRMGAVRPKSLSRSEDGFWITSERFSSFSGVDMIIGDLAHYSTQLNETEMNSKDIKCGQIIVNFVLKCMKKISIICECGASQPQSEESHVSTHNMSLYGSTNKNSRNTPMEPLLNDFSE